MAKLHKYINKWELSGSNYILKAQVDTYIIGGHKNIWKLQLSEYLQKQDNHSIVVSKLNLMN